VGKARFTMRVVQCNGKEHSSRTVETRRVGARTLRLILKDMPLGTVGEVVDANGDVVYGLLRVSRNGSAQTARTDAVTFA
jgi:hypothetical protein